MIIQNENSSKESIKILSTPKFQKILDYKENNSKNNSLAVELFSFDDSKYETKKFNTNNEVDSLINKEETKEKEGKIFKDNFSLSSFVNIYNNDTNKIDNINENEKNENVLISFCDKSENTSFNNEIIYKEKENNSSIITIKENKEENDSKINIIKNKDDIIKENKIINEDNLNLDNIKDNEIIISVSERKKVNTRQNNDSNSFKYNLPLEHDKTPIIRGFFEYDNIESMNKNLNTNKSLDLENNNLDFDVINRNNKFNKLNNKNNLVINRNNITYSKKKVKRNNTEKLSRTFKIIAQEKKNEDEFKRNKSLIEKGVNKITIKKSILHSCRNYNKLKRKIKNSTVNISLEKNEKDDELFLSGRASYNTISPKKKLKIIIKEIKINPNNNNDNNNNHNHTDNLDKENEDNINQINCFSSRGTCDRLSIPLDLDLMNINNKKLECNNNDSKSKIDLYLNNHKKFRHRKNLIKSPFEFNNTIYNFKVKKLPEKEEISLRNMTKEQNRSNKDIINISHKDNNSKKIIYKKSSKNIINNKKNNNYHSRNINNLYSNKKFNHVKGLLNNNILFNTINYENNIFKNKNNEKKNTHILHSQYKPKIQIKSSVFPMNKTTNKKNIFMNSQFHKERSQFNIKKNNKNNQSYNNVYNTSINKNISQNKKNKKKYIYQYKLNKNDNNSTYNKPNNLVFNHNNKTKMENKNEFYNNNSNNNINQYDSIDNKKNYNHLLTDYNSNNNNMNNFVNANNSSNSLLHVKRNSRFNRIKVNIINRHHKITTSPCLSYNINQNNNYWKIYKKPKNCCLLNKFNNDIDKFNYNNKQNGYNNRGNSQFNSFKENKIVNNYTEENNSTITNGYLKTQNNNYYTINNNLNIDLDKQELNKTQHLNYNKIYHNSNKLNKKNNSFKNKSNERRELRSLSIKNKEVEIENNNKSNINEDIIKLSIMRNNLNNQIIKEFSVVVGEGKNVKENKNTNGMSIVSQEINTNNQNLSSNDSKKTIINVNQYYPSYFINTNNI